MLSTQIHKDILEYKPKVIAGLTMRTAVALACALSVSVFIGVMAVFVLHIDVNTVMPLVWGPGIAACLVGFYEPHGMPFEKFVPLWFSHMWDPQLVLYRSATRRSEMMAVAEASAAKREAAAAARANPEYAGLSKRRGIELWRPGGELSSALTQASNEKTEIERFWDGDY